MATYPNIIKIPNKNNKIVSLFSYQKLSMEKKRERMELSVCLLSQKQIDDYPSGIICIIWVYFVYRTCSLSIILLKCKVKTGWCSSFINFHSSWFSAGI